MIDSENPKVYVVTDGTSALGKATALGLAKTGAKVIMVAPDESHGARIEGEMALASNNPNVEMQLGDLSLLSSVRNLAEILNAKNDRIDLLLINHWIYTQQRKVTVEGFEKMFAANYLSTFLLTHLLLERLVASNSARVLNLTSPTNGQLNFDDLQSEEHFNSINTFNATKTARLLFTYELARRLENSNIAVNALHTGLVKSEILNEAAAPVRFINWLFALSTDQAAEDIVNVATNPEFKEMHGKLLHKEKEIQAPDYALDPNHQILLWEMSEKLTDADWRGPNYDPTGSMAMFNAKEIPEGAIRPEEDPTITDHGVVKRE